MECDAEKLLVLIEQRPAIYNFKLKEYCNRTIVDRLWEEIATEMSSSVADCKLKWGSLRNSYNRAARECRDIVSGSKSSKKRKWYLMDAMEFLRDLIGVLRKLGSSTSDTNFDVNTERNTEPEFSEINIEEIQQSACRSSESENVILEIPASQSAYNSAAQFRKKSASIEKVVDPIISFLKSRTKPNECKKKKKNFTFFKSLIPDLEKLIETRKRKFKQAVLNELYKILEEQEHILVRLKSILLTLIVQVPLTLQIHSHTNMI